MNESHVAIQVSDPAQAETVESSPANGDLAGLPIIAADIPVMYEDEGQEEMGEATPHSRLCEILRNGLEAHLAGQPQYRVFTDLNCYYHPVDYWAYVSPDTFVVIAPASLPKDLTSYRIGRDGPAPLLAIEVLSPRSAQQQDLTNKPRVYSQIGVAEYIQLDVTGTFLPRRLVLKQRQPDGSWLDLQDADGGVTSRLGFRLVIENDGLVRVVHALTGHRYVRPDEAEAEAKARQLAEQARELAEQARQQEAEARRQAEQALQQEAEARRQAEQALQQEAEARRQAEQARQQAEERTRQLEAELERLRRGTGRGDTSGA